jgi:glutamate-1-semialdehyde 2,1-aminomutase
MDAFRLFGTTFLVSTEMAKDQIEDFLQRTAGSRKVFERAQGSIPSGSTRAPYYYAPYPLYMKKGEGAYVWDIDGNRYLDFANNMGPLVLGHRHPVVQKAVEEQVDAFWCGGPTEKEVKLAEEIKRAFPIGGKVLFTPSGSEATMKMIRGARAATGRDRIMMSTGAYHGGHDIVTNSPGIPKSYLSLVTRYSYNDEESFRSAFDKDKNDIAAVMVEAVLGHAGSTPPTKSFLKTIREETEKAGVAMIMDEVVTGFRVARGGICEIMGVKPDGVTLGKIIGGGFPVGAFLGSDNLMKEYEYTKAEFPQIGKAALPHAGTFNAHAVSMAAGLATLDVLTPDAYEHLNWVGEEASRIMDRVATDYHVPHVMTGMGSMFSMHFADGPINNYESAHASDEKKGRMRDALLQTHGINMPAFHTDFASLPMEKADLLLFESALQATFGDMKKLGAI